MTEINVDSDDLVEIIDLSDDTHSEDDDIQVEDLSKGPEEPEDAHSLDNGPNNPNTDGNVILTSTEEQVYDRQIRLWGLKAQERIMKSHVLFLGKNGIQEEAMKNLLLAGMTISLINDHIVTSDDVKLSFFLKDEDIYKYHSEALCNRMSYMTTKKDRINGTVSKFLNEDSDGNYQVESLDALKKFNVLCISAEDYPLHKLERVNEVCRTLEIAFFVSMSCGIYGYFFMDLQNHTVEELFNKNAKSLTIEYRKLSDVFNQVRFPKGCNPVIKSIFGLVSCIKMGKTQDEMDDLCKRICGEIGADISTTTSMIQMHGQGFPVTSSILGGYLALEVRKYVTKQHETIPNFCAFDMDTSTVATAML
ncbi:conserved hypothetical protein [Theileria equi strain WA]|uniref:THIF-type NAD/FAD binding fold domain-containing protein n=1 Tax=Theileria equi strain WA TaxID=1537102 RepID=L1LGM0_THEEQ|nr:conserved hypothetical protein [Theileria equi strain WA]EKX74405.1 conserved hypothetical protein [Theileria equi strain WA]|eukprot:XP_004833857.1 conserved hypothetical protein [Theileria equi strain WA]